MHPVLFTIPIINLPVHTYGVMIVSGFLLAMYACFRVATKEGRFAEDVLDFAFWALVGGMIGARIYFIIVNWEQYFITQPFHPKYKIPSVLVVWEGGLVFWGAALGGLTAFIIYCYRRKFNVLESLRFADVCILGLPLAHIFGRFGCVAAGCCWGDTMFHFDGAQVIADIPLAAQFPKEALAYSSLFASAAPDVQEYMRSTGHTVPLFPSQLAESFGVSLVFLALLFVRSRKWFHGQVVLSYFVFYPVLRSILEIFRGDPERGYVIDNVLSVGQATSIVVAIVAFATILTLRARSSKNEVLT